MLPKSPVVVGLEPYEINFGGPDVGQPQYMPLPALRSAGPERVVMSRWELTPVEREMIANGADVFVSIWTFGDPYPPTSLRVLNKTSNPEYFKTDMQLDRELDERLAGGGGR